LKWNNWTGADLRKRVRFFLPQYRLAAFLLLGASISNHVKGCGPDFPNWLLSLGDHAVLVAPEGSFAAELARMDLVPTRFLAIPPERTESYSDQSLDADLADLRRALKQSGMAEAEAGLICSEHQGQRKLLAEAIEARRGWEESHQNQDSSGQTADPGQATPPAAFNVMVTQGLPGEFADYFEGFIAWHTGGPGDIESARKAWERLLARPVVERKYKSTWAAFMLGKSWEKADPEKALHYFKEVRALAHRGYRDSLGLAAASLGLEARVYLRQRNYESAIETYLDQMASGDPTATNSLATAAAQAFAAGPETLRSLARNPRTQKVITAYLISRPMIGSYYTRKAPEEVESGSTAWLAAAEEAGIKDMDSAEALALAAYRANDMDKASRWIKRAPGSPVAQWLQAKLLLRAGKLQSAAALLARISPQFPIIHEGTNAPAPVDRKDSLTVRGDHAERWLRGELGVLRLSRGEYVQALDSLLNAGFWMDAAYVAERVLTIDELKNYVDQFWPAATADQEAREQERFAESDVCPSALREQIRYLLARRLARGFHNDQAREYYPVTWLTSFDQMTASLRAGWEESSLASNRAAAFLQAALIARTNGLELMGTEVAPDWHYHQGDFDWGVTGEERGSNTQARVVRPLADELRRNTEHQPDPNVRFHYRYVAASLTLEAAKLLPDNTDQTAYALWLGGSFLKYRDPETADFFYKVLVRRNRKTLLGAEADRQRWFPALDDNGNPVPRKKIEVHPEALEEQGVAPTTPAEGLETQPENLPSVAADQSGAAKGYQYVIHAGDSLAAIAEGFNRAGLAVTPVDILVANPGLDAARIRIGQVIFVPAKMQVAPPESIPSQP
jgi:hypothetical protein